MGFRIGKKSINCQPSREKQVQHENISLILNLFPEYSDLFHKTHKMLMSGNGSLPFDQRHYIAVMACKVYSCETLISIEERSFLATGGDQAWLHDPEQVPARLKRLTEVNNLLAETPWLVKPHHIKSLTTGKGSWTVSEIVHALAIISNYHALSSFVLGTGQTNPKQRSATYKQINQNDLKTVILNQNEIKGKQEFCWDEQGFSVMSTFYSDMANLIDDKMRAAKYLSSSFLNEFEDDQYAKYNQSIWYHVQSLHGIQHDDFNNEDIQEVLNPNLKMFIHICSNGSNTSSKVLSNLGNELGYSLKVFVSIILMEAKLQSELNFALEAVIKNMT